MKNNRLKITEDLLIKTDSRIIDAIAKLNSNSLKIVLVIDYYGKLVGTLTDGDIRRAILKNIDLNTQVINICNREPKYLTEPSIEEAKKMMLKHGVSRIPVVNTDMKPIMLFTLEEFLRNNKEHDNIPVVIMAGGEGKRLRPLTSIIPKPLIPVNGKPMLETIIDEFYKSGFSFFAISVNYKKEFIKSYFAERGSLPYEITFIEEDKPLGTAGSLSLMRDLLNSTFIVSNCDILVNVDYSSVLKFHKFHENDITVIGAIQELRVPYGVIRLKNETVEGIDEKPEYHFIVNTGIYVLEPKILHLIPENQYYDMTELINIALENKYKVSVYPTHSGWTDIGNWNELKKLL